MEQWYGLTQEEVLKRLSTNRTGLSEEEAEKRLEVYGENILKEQEEMPWWQIFLGQFKDLLVMILIGAAGVSMVTGDPESALVIFSVLLLNAVLGTVQHQKARRSLESLKRLASTDTLLLREGRICMVPASKVVPGDILVLETGGIAAADGRILQATGLTCNESSLTGEALNVEKNEKSLFSQQEDIALGDQSNMVFSGALITRRQRNSSGNSYGDGYPDREDRFFNEPHNRKENAASGQSGPVFRASGIGDHGNLRRGLSDQSISQGTGSGCPYVCGGAGSCGYPGSSRLHCDHCPGNGNTENGQRACSYQESEGSGKPWLRICDLLR